MQWQNHIISPSSRFLMLINLGRQPKIMSLWQTLKALYDSFNDFGDLLAAILDFKKANGWNFAHPPKIIFLWLYKLIPIAKKSLYSISTLSEKWWYFLLTTGYVDWILIYKTCKFCKYISYNFRNIKFFLGVTFLARPVCSLFCLSQVRRRRRMA